MLMGRLHEEVHYLLCESVHLTGGPGRNISALVELVGAQYRTSTA